MKYKFSSFKYKPINLFTNFESLKVIIYLFHLIMSHKITVLPFQLTWLYVHFVRMTSSIGTGFLLSLALLPVYLPGYTVKIMSSSCRASSS